MKPKKLTEERTTRLVELLRGGHTRESACASVGINSLTLRRWLAAADNGDAVFIDFAKAVHEAEANIEQNAVTRILEHGDKDWRALAWWLEKRHPNRWGQGKVEAARIEAEREALLDAVVRTLERRGLDGVAEDLLRELAGASESTPSSTRSEEASRH